MGERLKNKSARQNGHMLARQQASSINTLQQSPGACHAPRGTSMIDLDQP
tara:strand:- start:261 stop:410 length:150 start_codon:yes stop_codon:yes gene_type:complete